MTTARRPDPTPDPEMRDGVWAGFLEAQPRIRVAARCLFRRPTDGAWLVVGAYDRVKDEMFFSPPGGGMRFGERAEQTLKRELHEELGCGVTNLRRVAVLENHFLHQGFAGHEIVFIFTGELLEASYYEHDRFEIEDGGERLTAAWMQPGEFRTPGRPDLPPLCPDGLLAVIHSGL